MWVFGYGSLTWKADFDYEYKISGYIKGYVRRFYQHSVDHRGTPQSPGRVVTLLPADNESIVWGVAYFISKENEEKVINHLDYREKDGYVKETITFYPSAGANLEPFQLTLYIGSETNIWYAGPADIPTIAAQIYKSVGPSGKNIDYLYNLAQTMKSIAPDHPDEHLYSLEAAVRKMDETENKNKA